jgi:hypothetical protein
MYNGGAIWVPVGSFTWTVNVQINYVSGYSYEITNIAAPLYTQFANGSTWPSWSGNATNYKTWH